MNFMKSVYSKFKGNGRNRKQETSLGDQNSNHGNAEAEDHETSTQEGDVFSNISPESAAYANISDSDSTNSSDFVDADDHLEEDDQEQVEIVSDLHVDIHIFHDRIEILEIYNCEDMDNEELAYKVWYTEALRTEINPFEENGQNVFSATGLKPDESYDIYVVEMLDGLETNISKIPSRTSVFGPPYNFEVKGELERGLYTISWERPQRPWGRDANIEGYVLEIYDCDNDNLVLDKHYPPNRYEDIFKLETSNRYYFKIRAKSENEVGDVAYGEHNLKHTLLKMCWPKRDDSGQTFHLLKMNEIKNERDLVKVKEFGRNHFGGLEKPEKVILLVGATGAGKTTWMNAYVNYLFGVKAGDNFRFKIIEDDSEHDQTVSKTQNITVYRLPHQNGMPVDYSVTIIDTPGFGDTSGIGGDKRIEEEIHWLFRHTNGFLEHINAVAFVTPVSTARLTPTQIYIFDSILSLFGKNIKGNLVLLVTNAYTKDDKALRAMKKHGIKIEKAYYFENANLLGTSEYMDDYGNANDDMWKTTVKYFDKFSTKLETFQMKSVSQTQEVLDKRARLQLHISSMRKYLEDGLLILEQYRQEQRLLSCLLQEEHDLDKQSVTIRTVEYEIISDHRVHAICDRCNYTCHEKCRYENDSLLENCIAMDKDNQPASCKICPNKCPWYKHKSLHSKVRRKVVQKKVCLQDIKDRYHPASDGTLGHSEISEQLLLDLDAINCRVKASLSEIDNALTTLKSIALRTWPKSQIEYIHQLIETESVENQEGSGSRIELLDAFLKEAKYMQSVESGDFDPFKAYRQAAEEEIAAGGDAGKDKFWRKISQRFGKTVNKLSNKIKTHGQHLTDDLMGPTASHFDEKL